MNREWWGGDERIVMPRWCWAGVAAASAVGLGVAGWCVLSLARALAKL